MSSDQSLARRLATYAHGLTYDAIPADVRHEVKRRLIDSLGCAYGATEATPVQIALRLAREQGGRPAATLWGTTEKVPADMAAFVNGLMTRYLDCNDTYLSLEPAHPSDNLPAVLAVAEMAGRTGRDVITAAVLAYEIQCRLCDAASIRAQGWDHVSYGLVSVALAAGKLLGLDQNGLEQAVNLAVNPHQAMRQTRAGELSMWKGAAFANAARNAIFAAMLASYGMTGPAPIFEGTFGFFNQVSGGPFELQLGEGFMLPKTYIKHFPVEYHAQVAVELALELYEAGLRPDQIETITIETFKAAVEIIAGDPEKWAPRTRETADHSLPYCFVVTLLDGEMTAAQFAPERLRAPEIAQLLARARVVESPALTAKYPDGIPTRIIITTRDGGRIVKERDYALGHPNNPMNDRQVEAKFYQIAGSAVSEVQARRLFEAVWHLDEVTDLSAFLQAALP